MTTITNELTVLRTAIEARDADAVTAHYAFDATLTVLDVEHPPSAPAVYRGKSEIAAYYRDICGRNISHQVGDVITGNDRFSFVQRCRYPSGEQVVCLTSAEVGTDGLIMSQIGIQVWDS
jgi:hypothetical protein